MSLTGNGWEKHFIVTGPAVPCILGIDFLWKGLFKNPKRNHKCAFEVAAVETKSGDRLSTRFDLSDDPSLVGLLRVQDLKVPIAFCMVHHRQY